MILNALYDCMLTPWNLMVLSSKNSNSPGNFVSCKNFSMSSVTSDDAAGGFRTVSFTFFLLALACFTIGP